MFPTRTQTIEFLLDYALKANPQREPERAAKSAGVRPSGGESAARS
jgi:hypothetical protein